MSESNAPDENRKSSFPFVDVTLLFREMELQAGETMLDAGCGWGEYTLAAAEVVGAAGRIVAVDVRADKIEELRGEARRLHRDNITALVTNAGERLPLPAHSVDRVLVASVLHDFVVQGEHRQVLDEIIRVLRSGGELAVVEFKKIDGPPGPPRTIRLAPEELDAVVEPFGFRPRRRLDVGPYHYLTLYAPPPDADA